MEKSKMDSCLPNRAKYQLSGAGCQGSGARGQLPELMYLRRNVLHVKLFTVAHYNHSPDTVSKRAN